MSRSLLAAIEAELTAARHKVAALESAKALLAENAGTTDGPRPGHRMADGTIYVGISPSDGRPMYAMPMDIEGHQSWFRARDLALTQTFGDYADWHVPTKDELDMLYHARETVGGFVGDYYWSSTEHSLYYAWYQYFGHGYRNRSTKTSHYRVRFVRSC